MNEYMNLPFLVTVLVIKDVIFFNNKNHHVDKLAIEMRKNRNMEKSPEKKL